MTITTLITLSPDELDARINQAINPHMNKLSDVVGLIRPHKSVLTVPEIAADSGVSQGVVRSWIKEGRTIAGKTGKVKLKIMDGISEGPYRIRWETYRAFLAQFPDVAC